MIPGHSLIAVSSTGRILHLSTDSSKYDMNKIISIHIITGAGGYCWLHLVH